MKIDYKKLAINIVVPLALGAIVGFITGANGSYESFVKPSFAPPAILFPIVWSILYILLGVSSYLIGKSNDKNSENALSTYYTHLVINLIWSFLFFTFKWYLFSFLWIILMLVSLVVMMKKYYVIDKTSAHIQIPYLLWLIFAGILNFSIFLLNT